MEKTIRTRLEQVLERHLNGHKIAVWGTPTRSMQRILKPYEFHISESVDVREYYVVAVNDDDLNDFLTDEQSKHFEYVNDYLTFDDEGGELPFERKCFGVKIGRETYFGDGFVGGCEDGYIESIGHFTSINGSADIGVNHQLNMIFTSDDIAELFTDENKALFKNKLNSDKQFPYARSKNRITIGNDVYIGANAFINASRVTGVGDGAIIGSGAVVLEDVPPYAVVVGVPAKIKRYRFSPKMIEVLLRVKWWNWSVDEINANADALMSPELFMDRFSSF
jgi:aminocyclitol acetyltransferase